MRTQDGVFAEDEGDNWFKRNREGIGRKDNDLIINILESYELNSSKSILEIGCANGFRLDKLSKKFGSNCTGIEVSQEAINDGRNQWPHVRLHQGRADSLPVSDCQYDVVIVNFVLHWIDRQNLLKVVSEVDRVIAENGLLVIGDFYPEIPSRVFYHHRPDQKIYTYKQKYFELFTSTNLYSLIEFQVFNHSDPFKTEHTNFNDRCCLSVLKKETDKLYVE